MLTYVKSNLCYEGNISISAKNSGPQKKMWGRNMKYMYPWAEWGLNPLWLRRQRLAFQSQDT